MKELLQELFHPVLYCLLAQQTNAVFGRLRVKMNGRAYSILSLFDGSRYSINHDYESNQKCASRKTSVSSGNTSTPPVRHSFSSSPEQRHLMSTFSIARLSMQESIPEFVIPVRTTPLRGPNLTAKSELMTYLDHKEVRDYNTVIKKEMTGGNVASIKRRIGYDNVKEFELNKRFPQYENNDLGLFDIDTRSDNKDSQFMSDLCCDTMDFN